MQDYSFKSLWGSSLRDRKRGNYKQFCFSYVSNPYFVLVCRAVIRNGHIISFTDVNCTH